MLKLMYITNRPEIAQIAEAAGVDRIFVDLEYIGKSERQGGMDTVQSRHTLDDVKQIADSIEAAELLVRVNPIHEKTEQYMSSEDEIRIAIENGADILMLPFFKSVDEVKRFVAAVDGRAKTMLLLETPESVDIVDDILLVDGIDFMHIGLNDLSLAYKKKFMFELLTDGTVEMLCHKIAAKGIPYGFGGIAALGKGMLPAERVIAEHYRLGSTCAILSRSFCNVSKIADIHEVSAIFDTGLKEIRNWEKECANGRVDFLENQKQVEVAVAKILEKMG